MRLGLCVAMALGCTSTGSPSGAFSEGIDVSLTESGPSADRFDFAHARELWVKMRVAALNGNAQVGLTLTTPSGDTRYESHVVYSSDPSVQTMNVPGAPHPVTVFPARPSGGGYVLEYVVPIAGSAASRLPAPGPWQISAAIQGGKVLSKTIDVTF